MDYKSKIRKHNSKDKGSKSALTSIIKALVLIFALILGSIIFLRTYYKTAINTPNSESTEKVHFTIESGESLNSISNRLISQGLLPENKKNIFKIYLKTNNLETKIQAGEYIIPKDLNIKDLTKTLQSGKIKEIWIRVPEGYRADQIGEELKKDFNENNLQFSEKNFDELVKQGDDTLIKLDKTDVFKDPQESETTDNSTDTNQKITTLEGLLYPDSYLVPSTADEVFIVNLLLTEFEKSTQELDLTYEDIIIASMIEREGTSYEDKQIISGVIRKRLEEGWRLEIDATLLYPHKDWKHVITVQDKEDDNPYNTYKKLGLPPTPICNPSLDSLKASKNPKKTEYYYYIHDPQGNPHYSKNYTEHLQNIEKYLKQP